jgi:hypothetical protein
LLTTAPGWYVLVFIAVGIPATALGTGLITGTQQASPPRLRGRILSLVTVAQALGQATGILAGGLLSAITPLPVLLNAQAGCYLACAIVALRWFDRPRQTSAMQPQVGAIYRRCSGGAMGSCGVRESRRRGAMRPDEVGYRDEG